MSMKMQAKVKQNQNLCEENINDENDDNGDNDDMAMMMIARWWRARSLTVLVPTGSPSRGGDVMVYVVDINQPSLPTPFYSVLVSSSVFTAFSTAFYSINSPNNSPISHSLLQSLILPYWSFQQYVSLLKSSSALNIIHSGELGSKYQLTNKQTVRIEEGAECRSKYVDWTINLNGVFWTWSDRILVLTKLSFY